MADTSTQTFNSHALRMANALLRANGGTTASLQMPPATPVSTDPAQLGITAPGFELLPLAPAVFRRVRATVAEGQPAKYELLVSAVAVQAAISQLQLSSADTLFAMAAGAVIDGKLFLIEETSISETLGQVYMYRLLLRESASGWQLQSAS
ncbi:hypothetical protein [Silvibacterium acidisoli]|uniref:hypothetical protein n=1 Tax=Acidobacteriaceae bacterium ZG23-2 TaxID=2883246 RepID=UPI00406C4DF0